MELRFRAVTFGGAPSGTKRTYVSIGLASTLSVVYFVSNSLLGIQRPKKLSIMTRKSQIHIRILIYLMWPYSRDASY